MRCMEQQVVRTSVAVRNRRRPIIRFGLRTLLIAITLLGVWLGLRVNQARRNRQAIDAARTMGGFVEYAHQFPKGQWGGRRDRKAQPPGPAWLRERIGDEYFVSVVGLQFTVESLTDADLEKLSPLTDLDFLSFQTRQPQRITGSGLAHLSRLHKLRSLDLTCQPIADDALRHLRSLKSLEFVCLHDTKVTDAGMVHLRELPKLKCVVVSATGVTDLGLSHLCSLPTLTSVVARSTKITDAGVEKFNATSPSCKVIR
jgi:hypothetical protein